MSKKVVIIGSALSGNKGASAMLESSVQTLGEDTEFTLLSMYPKEDARQNPYPNLSIVKADPITLGVLINTHALMYRMLPFLRDALKKESPAIKAIAEADVMLDQGGITFVDGREKFLLYNVASILPALFIGTPVVKCAQALGPFKNPINNMVAKIFLPRMAAIVSRGSITHSYLEGLKLKNVTAGADYAFSLDVTDEEAAAAKQKYDLKQLEGKKVVGVSPSVVMQKKVDGKGGDYTAEIVQFINYATSEGYKVMLVPHSVRSNTDKLHNNDMPLCKNIFEQIEDKTEVLFLDQELSSQELRYWIGQCDYFVASRFHAMVSSLSMEVPTIVIGWSHKYREVLEMFELEKWAFGQDKLSQEYLREQFKNLVAEEQDVRKKLATHLPEVKKLSLKQVDIINEVIDR